MSTNGDELLPTSSTQWQTADEINYLNNIGTFRADYKPEQPPTAAKKRRLLAGALRGYSKRSEWGRIDSEKVIAHAQKLLAGL